MKNKKFHTVEQFQNLIDKILERRKIDTPNTQIHFEI